MLPIVAIVGRPNVGKSTLFNRLTRSREAIVADAPGVTRDRNYGRGRVGGKPYLAVDTGGFDPLAREGLAAETARQARQAVDEADAVVFVLDAREGLTPLDRAIAEELRRSARRVFVAANKAEGLDPAAAAAEFYALGMGEPVAISAAHGERVAALMEQVLAHFPDEPVEEEQEEGGRPRIAVVGRPNVGKSTLVNALVGEERVIVSGEPGTTRDPIRVEFERGGRRYTLIDTAGLRRRARVAEPAERYSVLRALRALEHANVAILVLDAHEGVVEQDAHVAGYVLEAGRALVVAVNKWDGLAPVQREHVRRSLQRRLAFLDFAPLHFISALHGQGIGPLLRSVEQAYAAATARLPTPRLTRALAEAVSRQAPPRAGLVRPRLRYAHQGGVNPPLIVVHGSALDHVPESYRRYLERFFREAFQLHGTPLRVEFRSAANPYARRRGERR
jgi:GTP-binding protein